MRKLNSLLLAAALFFGGCGSDDRAAGPAPGSAKVLVVNEGNFSQSNGSITSFDPETGTATGNLFESVNNRPLGDVVQSLYIDADGVGYIVVNNSRKIEVVDALDFTSTATIDDGLANPRYLVRQGSKLYVSNWGNFDESFQLDQSYVLILDAVTFEKQGQVDTDDGTENLLVSSGYLYAANSFTNTVSVIELTSGELAKTLETGFAPGEMLEFEGDVWLICGGNFGGNDGSIYKLTAEEARKEVELEMNPVAKLTLNPDSNELYFISGNKVGKYNVESKTIDKGFVENADVTAFSGIGFNATEKVLYVADARGFQANGTVYRYSANGQLLTNFEAGVGPNGFVFQAER